MTPTVAFETGDGIFRVHVTKRRLSCAKPSEFCEFRRLDKSCRFCKENRCVETNLHFAGRSVLLGFRDFNAAFLKQIKKSQWFLNLINISRREVNSSKIWTLSSWLVSVQSDKVSGNFFFNKYLQSNTRSLTANCFWIDKFKTLWIVKIFTGVLLVFT